MYYRCSAFLILYSYSQALVANPFSDISHWIDQNLIDSQDGMMDVSDYLAGTTGFLPVPVVITEPAVGFGLGAVVAYFHPPKEIDTAEHDHRGPPSISAGLAAKTENGTNFYGGAHMGIWKDDHIRYTGALAKADVNLTTYTDDRADGLSFDGGIDFNLAGDFFMQQIQFRLGESNWWLGGNYIFTAAENTFGSGELLPPEFSNPQFEFDLGGLGAYIEYDSRDSTFTASSGLSAKLQYRDYAEDWGSDFDYEVINGSLLHYTSIGDYSSIGVRLVAESANGNTPFFAYPFVSLRGIPAMRYQGDTVVTAEVEYLWGITPRWSLALFGGAGKTSDIEAFGSKGETVGTGGLGFRYRLARKLGLQAGVDVAHGPEGNSVYLTVGSAWRN